MSKSRNIADLLDSAGKLSTADLDAASDVAYRSGRKNRIINGGMQVDQRNAGAAVTAGAGSTYVVDRFYSQNTTTTGTITGQQSTLAGAKSCKLTATAAVTDLTTNKYVYGINTRIEAQNVYDLNSKNVTISFKVETNWAGKLPVSVINAASTRSYVVDVDVVSGVNSVSVTVPLEAATVATNSNAVGLYLAIGFNNEADYLTATTGSWIAGNLFCSPLSTQWTKTTGNFINITDLQLEEGSVATDFEHRSYGEELALCQRYFYSAADGTANSLGLGVNYTSVYMMGAINFPVTMRTTPTLSAASGTNYYEFVRNSGADFFNSLSLGNRSTNKIGEIYNNTEISGTVGHGGYIRTDNSAVFVHFDAEL